MTNVLALTKEKCLVCIVCSVYI